MRRRRRRDRAGAGGWRPLALLLILAALAFGVASADEAEEGNSSETDVYSIACDLPASVVDNLTLAVEVPAGLAYQPTSLSASGAADLSAASVSATGPLDGTCNLSLFLSFGTVNNSLDLDLLVEFVAVVANIPENVDGRVLSDLLVTLSFDDGLGGVSRFSGPIPGVNIVEPDLAVNKQVVGPAANGSGYLYEVAVFHTSSSSSPAYDLVLTDLVPEGAAVSPASVEVVSGPAGGAAEGAGSVVLSFDSLNLSWTAASPARVRYQADLAAGKAAEETGGKLVWTSAPGPVAEERKYSLNYSMEPYASIELSIDANVTGVSVGSVVSYVYTVKNSGFANLSGLVLVDDDLGPITLGRDSLRPGETATGLFLNREVTIADMPGPLVNNATVNAIVNITSSGSSSKKTISASANISLPFFENHLSVVKVADKKVVERGETVNYTITITNCAEPGSSVTPKNLVVEDIFNRPVEIISTSPTPDSDGKWRFGALPPKNSIQIFLTVRVPEEQEFLFNSVGKVSGTGFVNLRGDYSTSRDSFDLRNCVYVDYINGTTNLHDKVASCVDVAVLSAPGTSLSTREHGSGSYDSSEVVSVKTKDREISLDKDLSATSSSTTLGLYRGRTVTYSSAWSSSAVGKNRVTGASMTESYRRADAIDRESSFRLDKNESSVDFEAVFDGEATIGFIRMAKNSSTVHNAPLFEGREDYTGSFRVVEKIDEYGSAVRSEKSASGAGLVASDKRVGTVQRSYEHGTGSYDSEELIETYTNYIAKDISLASAPAGGSDLKWKEGTGSRVAEKSLLSEEYTDLVRLDKETVLRGLNEIETEANFSGRARYRTIATSCSWSGGGPIFISGINLADEWVEIANRGDGAVNMAGWNLSDDEGNGWTFPLSPHSILSPGRSKKVHTFAGTDSDMDLYMNLDGPIWDDDGDCAILKDASGNLVDEVCTDGDKVSTYELDFDEIYEGDYSIARRILISGASRYDRPHLNVTKTLQGITEETHPWGDEVHLAGATKTRKVANYTISVENDGNRALAPIRVTDLLPPGTAFIDSSLRPSASSEGSVNWTLTHLAIGEATEISLRLDVTGFTDDELTNRVEVCGGYGYGDGDWVCAANYTSLQRRWLTCCPEEEITVVKTARIDPEDPMVVLYTVVVENTADATRAATVTDYLPQGMTLLDSSLPVASSEEGVVVWVLPAVGPGEKVTIEFSALAPGLGRFTNVVEVEPRSVDGPGTAEPLHVASVVQVGSPEECESAGRGIWRPPAWDFQRIGYEPDLLGCEIFAGPDGEI